MGFLTDALIDTDGTIAPTFGECKGGMAAPTNGIWGYAPLVLSLANTNEVLSGQPSRQCRQPRGLSCPGSIGLSNWWRQHAAESPCAGTPTHGLTDEVIGPVG